MKRILVVDDHISSVNVLRDIIKYNTNNIAETSTDPLEAYELIKKNHIDLVISDTEMPGMTGLELKARLNKEGINVPFIGMSGKDEYEEKWRELGCTFLQKPYSLDDLKAAIEANL